MSPSSREQFGEYLLFKKLGDDALGETFRAGRVGGSGVEQVVLLRVLNGPGLPAAEIAANLPERAVVQQALKSPNIGNGIDLGDVRGVPYLAYDYISGKNLAALLAQAASQGSPIPTEHALLIAERIALGLAVAYETRIRDERILHGFLVPHLVMLSNEGETRILGFEVGPALRGLAAPGQVDPSLAPYLAPEVRSGAGSHKSDDVYSLGVLLFELLTGQRPPLSGIDPEALVGNAALASDDTPLPEPVAGLLKASLAPREERTADAVTWHKAINKVMIDGQWGATTFNLAFFMHNLFRNEIERETQEIEAERTISLPKAVPPPAPEDAEEPAPPSQEITASRSYGARSSEARGSKTGLWIGLAAALLVVGGGVGYWFWPGLRSQPTPPPPAVEPTPAPTEVATVPTPAPSPSPVETAPPGPSQDELESQLSDMIDARSKEMEARLKAQYDERIKNLQKQLEQSQAAAAAARERERQSPPAHEVAQEPSPSPATTVVRTTPAPSPSPAAGGPPATPPAASPTARAASPTPSQVAATPAPVATPSPSPPTTPRPQVRPPVIVPPRILREPEPRYPPLAKRVNKRATVEVRVRVDERGNVASAEIVGPKAGFGFDQAALEAARRAKFAPGTRDGVPMAMWYSLRIQFTP